MTFARRSFLAGIRPCRNAAAAAVIAYTVIHNSISAYYGAVNIGITYYGAVHINHGCIVPEPVAMPATAAETYAKVAAAIVDAAIETDLRSPVTCVV